MHSLNVLQHFDHCYTCVIEVVCCFVVFYWNFIENPDLKLRKILASSIPVTHPVLWKIAGV